MFLNQSRQRIEVSRPHVASECPPFGSGIVRRFHRGVNVRRSSLRDGSQLLTCGGIKSVEVFWLRRFAPAAIDEEPEATVMTIQPGYRFLGILRGGAVLHASEFFGDAHISCVQAIGCSNPRR